MIKKILGVGMILGVLFGSATFGADQYSNDSKDEGIQKRLPTPQLTVPVAGIQTFQCTESVTIDKNRACFCSLHLDHKDCGICGVTFQTCGAGFSSTGEMIDETTNQCSWSCGTGGKSISCGTVKCSSYARAGQGVGMGMNADCLVHGGCSLDVYKTLGIRANSSTETRTSVLGFFQDTISAATFFIGTILTISFLWAGFKFVTAGANGKDPSEAKKGMFYAVIGFALVMSAYAIIRFVQYLASTGG